MPNLYTNLTSLESLIATSGVKFISLLITLSLAPILYFFHIICIYSNPSVGAQKVKTKFKVSDSPNAIYVFKLYSSTPNHAGISSFAQTLLCKTKKV
jgi:hypothetical protein